MEMHIQLITHQSTIVPIKMEVKVIALTIIQPAKSEPTGSMDT